MPFNKTVFAAVFTTTLVASECRLEAAEHPTQMQLEFFEKKVRPLLAKHCYECHSVTSKKYQAGLLVDSRASLLKGGDSGEALVPNDVDGSLIIDAVRYKSYEMPPKGKLPAADIATLERLGSAWAHHGRTKQLRSFLLDKTSSIWKGRKAEHWVWQPIKSKVPPTVKNTEWPRSDLDRHVLSRLEHANLSPAGDADRTALLRRLYFDLIGLPPGVEEAETFLADNESRAVERVVDQLLESPYFGERWGRHWLDLVRYAESRGHEFDNDTPNAFQYRDYVIRALNADVPYDQFVENTSRATCCLNHGCIPKVETTNRFWVRDSGFSANGCTHQSISARTKRIALTI